MLAATYGLEVLSVEPQPLCLAWIRASLELMSARDARRVHLWNHFLHPNASRSTTPTDTCAGERATAPTEGAGPRHNSSTSSSQEGPAVVSVHARRLDEAELFQAHREARIALWHVDVEVWELKAARALALSSHSHSHDSCTVRRPP